MPEAPDFPLPWEMTRAEFLGLHAAGTPGSEYVWRVTYGVRGALHLRPGQATS